MRRGEFWLLALTAFLVLVLLSGCGQTQKLKVGLLPNEEALPVYIAEKEGLFEKAGLDVAIINFQSAAERDSAVQTGAIDGAEGDLIAVALMRQGGCPVKAASVALGATPSEGRFALLAAPGSTVTDATGIKGKTMGISRNTIIEFVGDEMLMLKGIDPKRVQKVSIPKMPLRLEMLLQKQVDTAVLAEPLASLAQLKGARVILDDTKFTQNLTQSVFFFRDDALQKKQAEINRFIDVYFQAAREATVNPEKYRSLFYQKANVPQELRGSFPVPKFSSPQLPTRDNVQLVISWLKEKNLLKTRLGYQDLVTAEVMK